MTQPSRKTAKKKSTTSKTLPPSKGRTRKQRSPKYAVALSFAGTERPFAEAVAAGLKHANVRVFYDRFEQHELWGRELYETLRTVYVKDCRYCVIILSPSYLSGMWTVFERQQIIDRLAHEHGSDCVLPVRLDGFDGDLPGFSRGISYLSVKSSEPDYVVSMLLKKLGQPGYEIDSSAAYARAVKMIEHRKRGFLNYQRVYTSPEHVEKAYPKGSLSGVQTILDLMGHIFKWRRREGEALELLGYNDYLESLRGRGNKMICRFEAPEAWVGCGRWQLVPEENIDYDDITDDTEVLIALYLYSVSVSRWGQE